MAPSSGVRCREITAADLDSVIDLLTVGFQRHRNRGYWARAIQILAAHPCPPGYPKYGYILDHDGLPVGVLLLIFYARTIGGATRIQCNTSSWYVMPAYRSYAPILARQATRLRDVTYLNITPSPHTWQMLEAQGYRRFANGVFVSLPILCRAAPDFAIQVAGEGVGWETTLRLPEADLLLDHAAFGCLAIIGQAQGTQYPFIFGLRRKHGIPLAHLAYCRDQQDFVRFARPLGQFLAKRGYPLVVLDCEGPVRGLAGYYVDKKPKYFKGPDRPPLGSLAYTERVMFGY